MAMRPGEGRYTRLDLIVVCLDREELAKILPPTKHHHPLTSMTVSKLKAVPFHSMNSPVCPPVNNLRPSGVHRTTTIGFFDFPID